VSNRHETIRSSCTDVARDRRRQPGDAVPDDVIEVPDVVLERAVATALVTLLDERNPGRRYSRHRRLASCGSHRLGKKMNGVVAAVLRSSDDASMEVGSGSGKEATVRRVSSSIGAVLAVMAAIAVWTRWMVRWGATPDEIAASGGGADWFTDVPGSRRRMTRAISIDAPPEIVWGWVGQLGRGAGWYSYDRLDNGGLASARHIVQWIPEPQIGDATSIGYLRHLEPGEEIAWWGPDVRFLGARTWSMFRYTCVPQGSGSRLRMRVEYTAAGPFRWLVLVLFPVVDSVMAVRQLRAIEDRAVRYGDRADDPENPETGDRDQYQLHHVIYAIDGEAGTPGIEGAQQSRAAARADGMI
jgi:proline iminopeptidase